MQVEIDIGSGVKASASNPLPVVMAGSSAAAFSATLASNKSNTTATSATAITYGGTYLVNSQASAYGGGAALQSLAADGVTWQTITTITTNDTVSVDMGANSSVRLSFPGAAPTALYVTISGRS